VNGEKLEVTEIRLNGTNLASVAVMILTPGHVAGMIAQLYRGSVYNAFNGFLN